MVGNRCECIHCRGEMEADRPRGQGEAVDDKQFWVDRSVAVMCPYVGHSFEISFSETFSSL